MDGENKRGFQLQWPWNWIVCGLFVVVAGYFIGYLWSALLAALFLWLQKKRHPNAVPQGGYCLDRTRKRLARLGWSLLYFVIAFACGVVFVTQMEEDRALWELEDWAMTVFCAVVAVGGAVLCLYETYTDLRDALCPAKSALARSIRAQLSHPDDKYTVAELFAMVDDDIRENGIWFDRVAVGKQWVLGDEASYIPNIRGVFPRDEIRTHVSANRRQTTRIVELHIVDHRRKVQITALRNPSELEAAVSCLRLRCPEARFAPHSQITDFIGVSDREWEIKERERSQKRQAQQEKRPRSSAPELAAIDQQGSAHVAKDAVAEELAKLKETLKEE